MKKYIYLMLTVLLGGIFGGCSKDAPFDFDASEGTGALRTAAITVKLDSEYGPRALKGRGVRAAAPSKDDFTIAIYPKDSQNPFATYTYGNMPEVVTLPVGEYSVKASYGENPLAAWDAPYYEGSSDFTIEKDRITENVDPIDCTVSNVRVSIVFTKALADVAGPDCSVTVNVGREGQLVYDLARIDKGESGYFRYIEGSNTLAATLRGTVDGEQVSLTKADITVAPGHHYIITFNLLDAGEEGPGYIVPDGDDLIIIETEITDIPIVDSNVNVDDPILDDDLRPTERPSEPGPDQPGTDDPVTPGDGPSITAKEPIVLNQVNMIPNDDTELPVDIVIESLSEKGITGFIVDIDMENVSDQELIDMGLNPRLDLAHTDPAHIEQLQLLNFPYNVAGQKKVEFSITSFVPMLKALNEGTHTFTLTVTDEFGTKVSKIILRYVP